MAFTIGETVVYPHHGAAYIEDISTKKIRGEEKLYLTLRVMQGDLVIQVPADKVEDVGVRDVSNDKQLENVFNVLRAEHIEELQELLNRAGFNEKASDFKRYGSARQLYNFKVDNASAY